MYFTVGGHLIPISFSLSSVAEVIKLSVEIYVFVPTRFVQSTKI